MKKGWLLLFIVLLIPFKVLGEQNAIIFSVDEPLKSFKIGDLELKNVKFVDNSNNSSLSFGLSGQIFNYNRASKYYETEVFFYDKDNLLLTSSKVDHIAIAGEGIFNHFLNTSTYKASEIKSYMLVLDDIKVSNNVFTPSKDSVYKDKEYVIDKYNVNMVVNANNTIDIEERITAYFNVSKRGIIRDIPIRNNIVRLDGTSSIVKAKIKNLSVNKEYTTSTEGDLFKIKIGNPNIYLDGSNEYIIKYTYDLGKDKNKKYDELYFNIIGDGWDTVIGNVSFTISMPQEFDSTKLGFSKGIKGSTGNEGILYSIKDNVISGTYNGILKENEGLTIRCELPEGYFLVEKPTTLAYIINCLPLIMLGLSLLIYYSCKTKYIVDTVELFPPDDYNSLEIGYLYKGHASSNDVVSLLIYLANQGYLAIEESEENIWIFKHRVTKIYRLKDIYDGDNELERKFFNGLFSRGKKVEYHGHNTLMVTTDQLRNSFYRTINKILDVINNKENNNKILKKSFFPKFLLILLTIITVIASFAIPIYYSNGDFPFFSLMISVFYVPFYVVIFRENGMPILFRIFIFLFITTHFAIMISGANFLENVFDKIYSVLYAAVGMGCAIFIGSLIGKTKIRTDFGNKMYGRIKGFRNFLVTAEKDKLESMIAEHPTYFYDILPYTYVLGISNKWIKKFESIAIPEPNWYDSGASFNMNSFLHSFNSTMSSVSNSMTSNPSSSGGGGSSGGSSSGSSGGGSSGGGSGGGGGSSW